MTCEYGMKLKLVSHSGFTMDCEDCCVTMEKVPGESYNFSDHLGVMAVFTVRRNVTGNQQ